MSTAGTIIDRLSGRSLDLEVGRNVAINLQPFAKLGNVDSLDEDLIRVGAYVYAADLAVKRHEREQHLRSITLRVPVVNVQAFERVRPSLEQALITVSIDNWTLEFVPIRGRNPARNPKWPKKENSTLMFSGGLDSFAGATELLKGNTALTLVSHTTHNRPVRSAQTVLSKAIRACTSKELIHLQLSVFGRNSGGLSFPSGDQREDTQRARSFLFIALSATAARLSGSRRVVVMAENGQFAIHLPLSEARIGSFSTHTAHPKFLSEMQSAVRQLFVCDDIEIVNPFVHATKSEVVALLPTALRNQVKHSTSCWRASWVGSQFTHCGECVPCLCRRIALETHKITLAEYERDLLNEDIGALASDDLGKRNLIDLCQFIALFEGRTRLKSEQDICYRFPELFQPEIDAPRAIDMYRRFAKEALTVLKRYPKIALLLK